ncbi:hypothetical protein ACTPOK_12450 [Streptomyces inhibens]|uniref:hypothetical protein n=1 Tax=Streptomyces inhibens TaxID=2293571 RepID=UPI00402AECB7
MLEFARCERHQIVLGSSRRKAWQYIFGPGVGATVARDSGPDLDVHIPRRVAKGRGLPWRAVRGWGGPDHRRASASSAPRCCPCC